MTRLFLWVTAATAMALASALAGAQTRPVVVELFTSQGCSSCPPADAYLGTLTARSDVLALAFHVAYWDDLGWRDRFALAQSVERQNRYALNLHRSSVYTPQLVIDGREDDFRSDGKAVARALSEKRGGIPVEVSIRDSQVLVHIAAQPGQPPADVVLVTYLNHAVSKVGRGENAGRALDEFNIVRDIRTLGIWNGEAKSLQVAISTFAPEATDVAVLIQSRGQGAIVGAASHSLR